MAIFQNTSGSFATVFYGNLTGRNVSNCLVRFFDGDTQYAWELVGKATQAAAPNPPEKSGWTFNDWFSDKNYKTLVFNFNNTAVSSDINLYAKFTHNEDAHTDVSPKDHKCDACQASVHTYDWKTGDGKYWKECACGEKSEAKTIPTITINSPNTICKTQNFIATFTIPENCRKSLIAGFDFSLTGDSGSLESKNGVYSLNVGKPLEGETEFTVWVVALTEDEYTIRVEKKIRIQSAHSGGTATCIAKAKCEICEEEYGEVDASNHTALKHVSAKAATTTSEGNSEYWYCEGCKKYFGDKDGKTEIKLEDTVIAKIVIDNKFPNTADNRFSTVWLAAALISGGLITGIGLYGRKKKYSAK